MSPGLPARSPSPEPNPSPPAPPVPLPRAKPLTPGPPKPGGGSAGPGEGSVWGCGGEPREVRDLCGGGALRPRGAGQKGEGGAAPQVRWVGRSSQMEANGFF